MESSNPELFQKALQELDVPLPRKLRHRPFKEAWDLWGTIYLYCGSIVFFLFVITYFFQAPYFSYCYGKPVQATVLDHSWESGRYGREYYVKVGYWDGSNQEHGEIEVGEGDYQTLTVGQQVKIRFLPLFHGSPSLDSYPPHSMELTYSLVLFIALLLLYHFWNHRGLLKKGKTVIGKITDPKERMGITFEFEGKEYKAQFPNSRYVGPRYFDRWKKGEDIIVLVDPTRPNRNVVYVPSFFIRVPVREQ